MTEGFGQETVFCMKAFLLLFLLVPGLAFSSSMKVFSMNLHCGLGDWKARMDLVVSEILKVNPDVIGLQEVCYNDEMNVATYIREKLQQGGYGARGFETIDTHRSFLKYQEQLLLITRHEVSETKKGYLPSAPTLRNGYVSFRIGEQWFLTTHLHFALSSIRKSQYAAITKLFADKGTIIFGDLNSNPADSETDVMKKSGWTSAFDGPTFPSDNPGKTFDGFWMSPRFYQDVLATTFELHFLNAPVQPSDHLGISLDLLFR